MLRFLYLLILSLSLCWWESLLFCSSMGICKGEYMGSLGLSSSLSSLRLRSPEICTSMFKNQWQNGGTTTLYTYKMKPKMFVLFSFSLFLSLYVPLWCFCVLCVCVCSWSLSVSLPRGVCLSPKFETFYLYLQAYGDFLRIVTIDRHKINQKIPLLVIVIIVIFF